MQSVACYQVSPLFDRCQTSLSQCQLGFIDFVVSPLFFTLHRIFIDPMESSVQNLVRNRFYFRFMRWHEVLEGASEHQTALMLDEAKSDNINFCAKSALSSRYVPPSYNRRQCIMHGTVWLIWPAIYECPHTPNNLLCVGGPTRLWRKCGWISMKNKNNKKTPPRSNNNLFYLCLLPMTPTWHARGFFKTSSLN